MGRFFLLAAIALVAFLVFGPPRLGAGGPSSRVTLAELAANPAQWEGRQVTVSARVIDRASVMGVGGVLIGDGSGHQVLAAGWTGPASPGSNVTVQGAYHLALELGDLQVPIILIPPPDTGG